MQSEKNYSTEFFSKPYQNFPQNSSKRNYSDSRLYIEKKYIYKRFKGIKTEKIFSTSEQN